LSGRIDRDGLHRVRNRLRAGIARRAVPIREPGDRSTRHEVLVCMGGSCRSCNADEVARLFEAEIAAAGLTRRAPVVRVGCIGLCEAGPLVKVVPSGVIYEGLDPDGVRQVVAEHIGEGRPVDRLELQRPGPDGKPLRSGRIPFFARQTRIALRNCGLIAPASAEEYIARDGYAAVESALFDRTPDEILETLKRSGLRGRGGGGFPVGLKWQLVREAPGDRRYVVCNADEGDPGAFMDRAILEGDPHSVLEAMIVAGRTIGSDRGIVYVRAEYDLAVETVRDAIREARKLGLLGDDILGSGFSFEIRLDLGAGSFVCGEETALIRSLEGRRGMPHPRPPFPARVGFRGRPTLVANVETLANVPPILVHGLEWFGSIGTGRSHGTKVIALAGKVRDTGLVEVAMGTPLRVVVDEIGGGVPTGSRFKGVHTGGPTGVCVSARDADAAIDYETFQRLGTVFGSGGLIVQDQATCVVELARYFLDFLAGESCGKCPPCRIGLRLMADMLGRITRGEGRTEDLEALRSLGNHVRKTSLCGLGQNAPNPVLSSMERFPEEYHAHAVDGICPAGSCPDVDPARSEDGR
jgi:NADH:ubiquinone oxidoreductase subunit F (NADH-binding)/(2Fe-2S) ferredoxin